MGWASVVSDMASAIHGGGYTSDVFTLYVIYQRQSVTRWAMWFSWCETGILEKFAFARMGAR